MRGGILGGSQLSVGSGDIVYSTDISSVEAREARDAAYLQYV